MIRKQRNRASKQVINNSRLTTLMTCPQLYDYRYRQHIEPTVEKRSALDFGTAIHAGLEHWYRTGMPEDSTATVAAFLKALPKAHDEEASETERSGYGEVMLKRYVEHWRENELRLAVRVHVLEAPLRASMPEGLPDAIGKADMIVERTDGFWIFDHKTMSGTESVPNYVRMQEMSFAWRIYVMGAREAGFPVQGVMLNMLRKLVIPGAVDEASGKKRRKGNLADWMPFERERLVVSDTMLRSFEQNYAASINVLHLYEASGIFPQHPNACRQYNRMCAYTSLCLGFPVHEEDWKERDRDYVDEINGREIKVNEGGA